MAKNLLSIKDLTKEEILDLIKFSNNFIDDEGNFRKENLFPEKIVANVFCEPSTRTKSSFAIAAGNLGCSVVDFNIDNSSVQKGESIFETVDALNLMGVDLCVLRHPKSVIRELAESLPKMVFINAGEGAISHPTQALLDIKTIIDHKNSLDGLKIVIDSKNWVMVRPSGTEPIIRIYGESDTETNLDLLIKKYIEKIRGIVSR